MSSLARPWKMISPITKAVHVLFCMAHNFLLSVCNLVANVRLADNDSAT